MIDLKSQIREIPNYPKSGINFKDITPLLQDAQAFRQTIDSLVKQFKNKGVQKVVGIDARGFLLASAVAYRLGAGLAIVRKKGKLPALAIACDYDLEYGKATIEMHKDAIRPGEKVIVIDDVLATGGTALTATKLVKKLKGNIVGLGFLIELEFLKGKKKLNRYPVFSLIKY